MISYFAFCYKVAFVRAAFLKALAKVSLTSLMFLSLVVSICFLCFGRIKYFRVPSSEWYIVKRSQNWNGYCDISHTEMYCIIHVWIKNMNNFWLISKFNNNWKKRLSWQSEIFREHWIYNYINYAHIPNYVGQYTLWNTYSTYKYSIFCSCCYTNVYCTFQSYFLRLLQVTSHWL